MNVVISRSNDFVAEGCKVVKSVEEGIEFARLSGELELMVIGGGEIYRQTLIMADKIYLTKVHHTFIDADVFFPEINKEEWLTPKSEWNMADEKNQFDFEFVTLERRLN